MIAIHSMRKLMLALAFAVLSLSVLAKPSLAYPPAYAFDQAYAVERCHVSDKYKIRDIYGRDYNFFPAQFSSDPYADYLDGRISQDRNWGRNVQINFLLVRTGGQAYGWVTGASGSYDRWGVDAILRELAARFLSRDCPPPPQYPDPGPGPWPDPCGFGVDPLASVDMLLPPNPC